MRPDDVKEQAETEHDAQCAYGADCHSRDKHIHSAYIPRILRERLRAAEKEIVRLRALVVEPPC